MATPTQYTLTGHPARATIANIQNADDVRNALHATSVGARITLTLSAPDEAWLKSLGAIK